jgi:hypothetical protein
VAKEWRSVWHAYRLGDVRRQRRFLDRPLGHGLVKVMAAHHAVLGVRRTMLRRKNVLPMPFAPGARVLARQRIGQMHLAVPLAQIPRMQQPHPLQVAAQRRHQFLR